MRFIILAALAAIAAPAAAADQFDLVCSGKRWTTPAGKDRPVTVRYRVDLAGNRWCKDACTSTEPFAKIREDMITFIDQAEAFPGGDRQSAWVNRQSGWWMESENRAHGHIYSRSEGTCQVSAFSGFAVPDRKF